MSRSDRPAGTQISSIGTRTPVERLGVAVVEELVQVIVTDEVHTGDLLPPEAVLSEQFGVSRTVIRESVKRLQEKGMVTVTQGSGTRVNAMDSWNILDPVILSCLIANDDSLGILDDLTLVRSSLESTMAADAAGSRDEASLDRLREAMDRMRETISDSTAFRQADIAFHFAVMEVASNRLAESIAKIIFRRALESFRYHGIDLEHAFELTLEEHRRVLEAIALGDGEAAAEAMRSHIVRSWERRRLPTRAERPGTPVE